MSQPDPSENWSCAAALIFAMLCITFLIYTGHIVWTK